MPATFSAMVGVFASEVGRGCAEVLAAKIRKTKSEKIRRFIWVSLSEVSTGSDSDRVIVLANSTAAD